jgi:hypothetical protein
VERSLTDLSETVANARRVSEQLLIVVDNLNAPVESNRPPIGGSVSNLLAFSDRINHMADSVNDVVATDPPEKPKPSRNGERVVPTPALSPPKNAD